MSMGGLMDMMATMEQMRLNMDRLLGWRTQLVVEAEAREQFPCPHCKVEAGWPCRWFWWPRRRPHKARVLAAALVNGGVDVRYRQRTHATIRASSRFS